MSNKEFKILPVNQVRTKYFFTKLNLSGGKFEVANKGLISDKLREEIAKELGVYEQVKQDGGWGNVPSKTCGNIVTKAIEIANRTAQ